MNKQISALPQSAYPPAEHYGCETCRNAFTLGHVEASTIPASFVPVQEWVEWSTGNWTRAFYACRECEAIWALTFNRKDRMYDQTPVPAGMAQALRPDATWDDLMVPLLSWPPIIELTEEALWELDYEPQELWDRLIAAWRDPGIEPVQQSDMLRMLARLVQPANPRHRELLSERAWLIEDLRDFENDLDTLEQQMNCQGSEWWTRRPGGPRFPQAQVHLQALKHQLAYGGVVLGRELQPRKLHPPAQPVGLALSGQRPLDDEALEAWYASRPSLPRRTLELLSPYWSFLPSVLIGWVLVEGTWGSEGDPARLMLRGFLLGLVLVFVGAGVAANAGISRHGIWKIALHRLGMSALYLVVALFWCAVMFVYFLAIGAITSTPNQPLVMFGAAAFSVWLMARIWPFWIVEFMQPIENDQEGRNRQLGSVRREALETARQLTRHWRKHLFPTTLWFVVTGGSLTLVVLGTHWWGDWVRIFLLYPFVLPILYAFTWALVEPLPDPEEK